MQAAFRMGWRPSDFWDATLAEVESAIFAQIDQPEPPSMTEDQQREFFDRMGAQ